MDVTARTPHQRRPSWLRFLLIPVVVVVTLVGMWVAGGLLTNNFRVSMLLVAVWMGMVFVASLVLWRRVPTMGRVVLPTFLATGAIVGGYLAYETFSSKTVIEAVAVAGQAGTAGIASGQFKSVSHGTSGAAAYVEAPGGKRFVTLTELDTDPGPDLRVYLTQGPVGTSGSTGDHVDLGGLKGNKGTQQYEIPAGTDLGRHNNVLIWCRAFSVAFGEATLQ